MKHSTVLFILLLALSACNTNLEQNKSEHNKVKETSANNQQLEHAVKSNDSIQYSIQTDKVIYRPNETINVTIVSKNISDHPIKIWLDAGEYPTGTDLCLFNSKGKSMVEHYWAFVSSQSRTEEEVELLNTTIKPNQAFKKEYNLHSIVQLKEDLQAGKYTLRYNNSQACKFEIN